MSDMGFRYVSRPLDNPMRLLVFYWAVWKSLILLIAYLAPGPGYDTSTHLLFAQSGPDHAAPVHLVSKLVKWDAIYFTRIAHRGTLFEQEWAFGWGFVNALGGVSRGTKPSEDF